MLDIDLVLQPRLPPLPPQPTVNGRNQRNYNNTPLKIDPEISDNELCSSSPSCTASRRDSEKGHQEDEEET